MASSGIITNAIRTGYAIQIAWTVDSQSVANNTSTVTANVQLVSTGSTYTINSTASKSGSLTINGTNYSFTFSAALSGNQTKTIFTKTVTVAHNADGSKTCSFSCSAGINVTLSGTYYGNVTASGNGVFNTIARASTISSVTASVDINGTNACAVSITRASNNFTHSVNFSFGSYSYTASNVGTSTSYAIPLTWLNGMPSATSGTATVTVTTYSGSTKIGNAVSRNFTVTVPSNIVPSISSVGISEAVSEINAQFQGYVQNKSKLAVVVNAAGTYSSTIKAYKTTILDKNYTAASFTSFVLSNSGTISVEVSVTDSRGRTATTSRTISVLPYTTPTIASLSCVRCTSSGVENPEGTYLKANINFAIASLNNKNSKTWSLLYKRKSQTSWSTLSSGSVYSYNASYLSTTGILLADYAFDIKLVISDYFSSAEKQVEIGTAFTLIDFRTSGKGIAFGKVSEQDVFECALKLIATKGFRIGNTEILEPCAISATLGGNNFRKTSADYEILPLSASTIFGNGLIVSNNGILIGQGISKIRISGQICYGAATTGLKTCAIWISTSTAHLARTQMNIASASLAESIVISPRIVDVAAGNLLTLRCHGTANDIIYGGINQTYFTVETIG